MTDKEILKECEKLVQRYVEKLYGEIIINLRRKILLTDILNDQEIDFHRLNENNFQKDCIIFSTLDCINYQKEHPDTWNKNSKYVLHYFVRKYVYPSEPSSKLDLKNDNLINI